MMRHNSNRMTMYSMALILEFVGEILIAISVVRVHNRVLKDHKLDRPVFRSIRSEQHVVVVGIVFSLAGFVLQMISV